MEFVSLLLLIVSAVLILKVLAFFLKAGIFILTIPVKIFGMLILAILIFMILIPVGVFGVLFVPLLIIIPLFPLLLLVLLMALVRKF